MQKAKYRNRKKGMETGRTKEGEQGSRKVERQHLKSHCEAETGSKRKGRNRGQVVRTGTEADERKRKERGKPESESKREAPAEQLWERSREG